MEIGTTIISTAEYMELRAMKDNLETRKAEIEANAECVILRGRDFWGYAQTTPQYIGKDEALNLLQSEIDGLKETREALQSTITTLSIEVQKNDPAKVDRSLPARLHFLFTGNVRKVGE